MSYMFWIYGLTDFPFRIIIADSYWVLTIKLASPGAKFLTSWPSLVKSSHQFCKVETVVISIVQVRKLAQRGSTISGSLNWQGQGEVSSKSRLTWQRPGVTSALFWSAALTPGNYNKRITLEASDEIRVYMGTREPSSPTGKVTTCRSVCLVKENDPPISMLWGSLLYQHPLAKECPNLSQNSKMTYCPSA